MDNPLYTECLAFQIWDPSGSELFSSYSFIIYKIVMQFYWFIVTEKETLYVEYNIYVMWKLGNWLNGRLIFETFWITFDNLKCVLKHQRMYSWCSCNSVSNVVFISNSILLFMICLQYYELRKQIFVIFAIAHHLLETVQSTRNEITSG